MAAVKQVVELNDKEIRDALIERAKTAINGKADGPNIQGSVKAEITISGPGEKEQYAAEVTFERPGK